MSPKKAAQPDNAYDWRATFLAARDQLPDQVTVPFERTPEGERLQKYRKVCPPEFVAKLDRSLLPNTDTFDRVALWDGAFPGPCASGATGTGKTRAAWSALSRLYVRENKPFAWFPVRRLVTELGKYEEYNAADEFFRTYDYHPILMVDDADKINWQFESQLQLLFAFYDWIYRTRKPCITTTNKDREWWANKMGEAFARRLFDDAHFAVNFT